MSTEYNIDDGLSPTIGVILIVAIVITISVVIGSFVLGFGGNTNQSVQAGVDIQQQGDGKYQVQWQTAGNAEELQVLVNGTELDNTTLSSPGESVTVGVSEGDTISVSGSGGGATTQVSSTTASSGSTSTPTVTSTPETTLSNSTSSDISGSGQTVTVDYSVTNESDSKKDMTVTLDVSDGVGEVDSTTESTVSSGETRTGSLTWDVPSDQETGEYTLTTSGGGETDSTTVEIQETPSFDIDVSSTSVRVGDTVSFSAKNVDATNPSYDWDFDDGNTKTGKDVTHTFASEGGYDVELSVTDENGVTETKTVSISVTNSTILDFESGSLQSTWEGTRGGWDVQSSPTYNGNYALVQTDASAARSSIKTTNGPMSDWDPGMTVASHIYVTNNDDYHGSKPRVSLLFDDGSDTHLYLSHNHAADNGGGTVGFKYVEDGTVVDSHGAGGSSSGPDFSQDTWFRWEVTVNADGGYTVTVINTDTGQEKAQFTGPAGTIDTSKLGDEIAVRTGDDPPTGDAFDNFKYVEENP